MSKRKTILVTNDDGITAPGIRALVETAKAFGDVVVVAPDSPQSGQGHAITITQPIKLNPVNIFGDIEAYECSGTPVDCVKLAKSVLFKDRQIDLCVSGINHGSNAAINIIYSGTMSAAMEASLEGIQSIGFSLLDFSFGADFTASRNVAHKLIGDMLAMHGDEKYLLNVNIPKLPVKDIKGIKVCKQGEGSWTEEFQEGIDPRGEKYYWLTGRFNGDFEDQDSDIWALNNGYVSVVPSHHDLTHYNAFKPLKFIENENIS